MKYDFLKGKNNFQCGIDISRNLEKNQIDLNLLLLNMPKSEYGIGLSDGRNQKNLFIIDNKKSNKFFLNFDANKLKDFDKLIIYNIDNYYDNLFTYDLNFLGLYKKSDILKEEKQEIKENKVELEDIKKIPEKIETVLNTIASKNDISEHMHTEEVKDEEENNQFKALLPQWSKISEDKNKQKEKEQLEEIPEIIAYNDNVNEENNINEQEEKPIIINKENKELIKLQNAKIEQLNKKTEQPAQKPIDNAGIKITKHVLYENFRQINPFEPKIKNHEWFVHVDNSRKYLVELNGNLVDYQTLYFNANNLYKKEGYPQRIIGYYNKENGSNDIDYIVLGVFGEYKQIHQPMRGLTGYVYWHNIAKDSELGYWIVYLELSTGKIVVPLNKKK
ncbi:MAG: hypothetical protein GYA50_10975 [Eubacteriaceae bacterium]|nr:hypothetical protein [Eubacteriaceae bacterium]